MQNKDTLAWIQIYLNLCLPCVPPSGRFYNSFFSKHRFIRILLLDEQVPCSCMKRRAGTKDAKPAQRRGGPGEVTEIPRRI